MRTISVTKKEQTVLVGVIKNERDLNILLTKNWYRIPVANSPNLQFIYLAFYQPALFGKQGKSIRYYARVLNYKIAKRKDLLPDEPEHPRALDYYFQFFTGKIEKLSQPVKNIIPRRVSFGFTTLDRLLKSKNILQLYGVAPTEQIMEKGLKRAGIKVKPQHYILINNKKRYRLDLAIFCKQGAIAIECDNKKAHSGKYQQKKDRAKNTFLRRHGWIIVRLQECKIIFDLEGCVSKVKSTVQKLGGTV
jgi:very-short-patch-repair endonuclease